MTISELHSNEDLRRHEFPVVREKIFLAHAAVCPLARRVAEAVADYAGQCTRGDQETLVPAYQLGKTRELAARLIGAQADEIAFVGPTSLALSFVAEALPWAAGDNVVGYADDYPSNVYPWSALARKGVKFRSIDAPALGRIGVGEIARHVDERTRLVALASCHFISGFRPDLRGISRYLRPKGVLFCVDGIQTVGAFPMDAREVDFVAADAHKWMLGPSAAGILFVRNAVADRLAHPVYGWNNIACPEFIAQDELRFRRGARGFEAGSYNLFGLVGLRAAFELLLEIGVGAIADDLIQKRNWLAGELEAKGYEVVARDAPAENRGAIVSFHRNGTDLTALFTRLQEANIMTSLRADRSGRRYIRLSPHFYNTRSELERLIEQL